MKLIPALCMLLLIFCISCKKSNNQPNIPPPVTDTVKTPVVKIDTSTLLKSLLGYTYDASGTTITDSSLVEWKYDDQRRIVQQSLKVGTLRDTVYYTYSGNGYTTDDHAYTNGTSSGMTHTIYYQHLPNRTDSAISNSGTNTYYYYNQSGQDSLLKQVFKTGNTNQVILLINYFYTGQNLDSAVIRDHGILSSVSHYTNGDFTGSDTYTLDASNVLENISNIMYSNILSGGLKVYTNASKLVSGTSGYNVSTKKTSSETDTYQFDTENRVSVWIVNNNQPYFHKYLLTWY